jgi:hypothetical protein
MNPYFKGSGKYLYNQANMGSHYFDLLGEVSFCNDLRGSCPSFYPLHCHRHEFDMGVVNSHYFELRYCKITEQTTLEDYWGTPHDCNRSDWNYTLGRRLAC